MRFYFYKAPLRAFEIDESCDFKPPKWLIKGSFTYNVAIKSINLP